MSEPAEMPAASTTDRLGWRRDISLFFAGQAMSMFGSSVVQYALIWHLALQTDSGWILTLTVIAGMAPQAIMSIFGGVWADRVNRKFLIMGADAVIAVVTLALAIAVLANSVTLWAILAALVVRSLGAGIQMPAVSALIPQLVPTSKLMRINGINSSIQSAVFLIAPAVAAALLASIDLGYIFFVDVVTAVIGIGFTALVRAERVARTEAQSGGYFGELAAGIRFTFSNRIVRRIVIGFSLVFLFAVPPTQLTILMIPRTFGPEEWRLAFMEIAWSGGTILGGAIMALWGGMRNRMAQLLLFSGLFGLFTIAMGLTPLFWLFILISGLYGLSIPFASATGMTALQERVPPEMQGRVFSLLNVMMAFATPLGMLVAGPLADVFRIQSILISSGVIMLVATLALSIKAPVVYPVAAEGAAPEEPTPVEVSPSHPTDQHS